jgi:hypothetical protein
VRHSGLTCRNLLVLGVEILPFPLTPILLSLSLQLLVALMDPSRDISGSSEQEAFGALRREELARAQSAAQAQREPSRPTTPSRVPVATTETGEQSDRSNSSVDSRLKILEAELKALMSSRMENESNHPSRRAADISSSRIPPERRQEAFPPLINQVPIRNKRFTDVLAVATYRLADKNENLPYDQSMSLTQVANQIRPRMEGFFFRENILLMFFRS